MTSLDNGNGLKAAALRRSFTPALLVLASLSAAAAADGDLQRVLRERDCPAPQITVVQRTEALTLYRVNCLGTAHKVIDIACVDHHCIGSRADERQNG